MEIDKYELKKAVDALISTLSDNPNDYVDSAAYRQVQDRIKKIQEIINPSEPQWFTEMKDLYSPSEMADDMIEGFDMSTLRCYARDSLEESLSNRSAYLDTLQNGWVGKFYELETPSEDQPYDDAFLKELSEYSGRPVEQYKTDNNLAILDYLRKKAKPTHFII